MNLRPHESKSCALPPVLRLGPDVLSWRKGWDSNPRAASHRRRFSRPLHSTALPPFRGAGAGTRTPNLRITNPLLCQLSHTGVVGRAHIRPALTFLAPFCLFLILGCTPETYTTRRLFTGPSRTRTRILPYCRNFPGCSAFAEKILPTVWRAIFSHYFSPWSFVFGKSCRFPASQPCVDSQSWESLVMNTAPPPKPSVRGLLQVYPHSNPTEHFDLCSRITAWTAFTISSIFGLPSLYNHKESGLLMTLIPSIPSK